MVEERLLREWMRGWEPVLSEYLLGEGEESLSDKLIPVLTFLGLILWLYTILIGGLSLAGICSGTDSYVKWSSLGSWGREVDRWWMHIWLLFLLLLPLSHKEEKLHSVLPIDDAN